MAVKIIQATTASFGTSGSAFGSMININAPGGNLAKTINVANFPVLAGQLPTNALLIIPTAQNLEITNDGGTTWTGICSGPGTAIWYIDGFTSRLNGSTASNVTFVAMRQTS